MMATYASSSNPFIKANSGDLVGADSAPKRKDAPGMAMPHSQALTNKQRDKVANSSSCCSEADSASNRSDLEEQESKVDNIIDLDVSQKAANDPVASEFDEITKACESLVETTIRLELEEAAAVAAEAAAAAKAEVSNRKLDINGNHETITATKNNEKVVPDQKDEVDDDGGGDDEDEQEDSGHRQHLELIKKLRLQLRDLERYAYERGELGPQIPASVISERQTVILDTLKERLSLSIDMNEIEKLELDELKKQVDKELHELIDPLVTKDQLLGQLKSQLTDLERYISYLHGTIGKIHDKSTCTCHVHGCCTSKLAELSLAEEGEEEEEEEEDGSRSEHSGTARKEANNKARLINHNADTLPKTTKLIRSLVTQLICSDIKLRENAKKAQILEDKNNKSSSNKHHHHLAGSNVVLSKSPRAATGPNAADDAAWTLHIDKVILATDSLVNLFTTEPEYQRATDNTIDDRLVESIVRRQLLPAIRDLLSYGLIDLSSMPKSTSYVSLLFDPYYLLTSLTCFPSSARATSPGGGIGGGKCDTSSSSSGTALDKFHLWNVIEEYYQSRNDPAFKNSSVKTLSQSFDLAPSISGPIKITSKQALLIAIDDINETLSKCRPNGPESHFRAFIYTALNRAKLSTWLRIVFRNKSICRRFYHNFSFVGQADKMDKLIATLEPLAQLSFKLRTDVESIEQFVSAF